MSKNILEALGKIDVALGGNVNDAVNIIDALDQISQGAGSLKTSVDNINGVQMRICGTGEYDTETGIPTIENPVEGTFYLTPAGQQDNNIFNEYYYKDGQWEKFGSASVNTNSSFDLSDRIAKGVDNGGNIVDGAIIEGMVNGSSKNKASANYAHAEGANTTASGVSSHAEGKTNSNFSKTINNKTYTQAGAYGQASHSEGVNTLAIGGASHAEGGGNIASGEQSHVEGAGNIAQGMMSHAEGNETKATGSCSHAEGGGTIANRRSQHVFGEYNIEDTSGNNAFVKGAYVEIIGNGTSNTVRSNARTLDWSGNETLSGSLTLGKGTADEITITAAQLKALLATLS